MNVEATHPQVVRECGRRLVSFVTLLSCLACFSCLPYMQFMPYMPFMAGLSNTSGGRAWADAPTDGVGSPPVRAATPPAAGDGSQPHDEAMAFAAEHHPELAELLRQLRAGDPRSYAEAIADIERALDRLGRMRERQPERYVAAIEDWKLSSRIRLVLARMALSKDPLVAAELEDLVRARQEVRLAPLRAERERLEKRLEKIGATLTEYDRDPEAAVERECRDLVRRAAKSATSRKSEDVR